jgi:hypothetical protein
MTDIAELVRLLESPLPINHATHLHAAAALRAQAKEIAELRVVVEVDRQDGVAYRRMMAERDQLRLDVVRLEGEVRVAKEALEAAKLAVDSVGNYRTFRKIERALAKLGGG